MQILQFSETPSSCASGEGSEDESSWEVMD